LFHNIQWRITFPFILLIVIIMGILGAYLVNSTRNHQLDNLRSQLENEARITAEASLPGFLSPDREQILSDIASKLGEQINTRITIIALDGTVLGDSEEDPATMENHAARPEIRDAFNKGLGESTRYSTTLEQRMMYVAVPISHQSGVLGIARVALPLTEVDSLVHRVTISIATATAIAALLVILAAWLIARITTWPIRKITEASRKIASGELELVHCVDPMEKESLYGEPKYYRLHGGHRYRHQYTKEELENLKDKLEDNETYVMFNNLNMYRDALAFHRLMKGAKGES
jgi:two-component system phosphate regulon sensor histidine kinase PhoR